MFNSFRSTHAPVDTDPRCSSSIPHRVKARPSRLFSPQFCDLKYTALTAAADVHTPAFRMLRRTSVGARTNGIETRRKWNRSLATADGAISSARGSSVEPKATKPAMLKYILTTILRAVSSRYLYV